MINREARINPQREYFLFLNIIIQNLFDFTPNGKTEWKLLKWPLKDFFIEKLNFYEDKLKIYKDGNLFCQDFRKL